MPGFSSFAFGYTLQDMYSNREIWLTYLLFQKRNLRHPNKGKNDKVLINFRHPEIVMMRIIRESADKSLDRPTSPISLDGIDSVVGKMGLFMCRIAILFLLQRLK